MEATSTIENLLKEVADLNSSNLNLIKENKQLQKNIEKLQNEFGLEICEFFHNCNSIRETTEKYYFKHVRDCYEALVDYNGCTDPLYEANDFKDCFKEIYDKEYSDAESEDSQNDIFFCDESSKNKNPEIRGTCVSCEYIDNLEEGVECKKCGRWVCQECASFKDDGNYYCVECCSRIKMDAEDKEETVAEI
jgi:sugar-specific transcriptional regulator TrmB